MGRPVAMHFVLKITYKHVYLNLYIHLHMGRRDLMVSLPWRRTSGLDFTARGTWFNSRCSQIGSSQCHVQFYSGMRRSPSESNGKLLTYNA